LECIEVINEMILLVILKKIIFSSTSM